MKYATPAFEPPYRVLLLAASTDGWYQAPVEEREQALDFLSGLLGRAQTEGARLIGSFDDDVLATGQPLSLPYSIYVLYEVDDLNVIVRLVHELRVSPLARMLRLEARVGRPLFLLAN